MATKMTATMTMSRTVKWAIIITVCVAVWFVVASYAFIFLVGLHDFFVSRFNTPIPAFYNEIVSAGFQPWAGYWTYLGKTDGATQKLFIAAGVAPVLLCFVVGAMILRGQHTRRRLTRWPWQVDDSRSPLA